MEKDLVVIDTCVWLQLFLGKKTDRIVRLVSDHHVVICSCPELVDEILRHLFNDDYFQKRLAHPAEQFEFFQQTVRSHNIDQRFDRAADIKDNFLFDLAYTVKAYYLVTSEVKLLNMKHVNEIQIIAPEDYFKLFGIKF